MITVVDFLIDTNRQDLLHASQKILENADERPTAWIARYLDRDADAQVAKQRLLEIGLLNAPLCVTRTIEKGTGGIFFTSRYRRWSREDIDNVEYCATQVKDVYKVSKVEGFPLTQLDGDPRLALERNDARRRKHPWLCSPGSDQFAMIVRRDGLDKFQNAPFGGFDLLPTRQYVEVITPNSEQLPVTDPNIFSIRAPDPKHEWWSVAPRLELPRMHPSVVRIVTNRFMTLPGPDQPGPGGFKSVGEPFDDFQFTWSRSALDRIGPFDIARTWETFHQPPRGARIIVSQKAVRYLREVAADILLFFPVRILED